MIQSRLSYRFIFKIVVFFIFSNFFIASFCTVEKEFPKREIYDFEINNFLFYNVILLLFCGVVFMISYKKKIKIIIGDEKIIIQNLLTKNQIEFPFTEITGLTWGTTQSSYDGRLGPGLRSMTQNISVSFLNKSELVITNYEYRNYTELRDFFYNYCLKNHLIENVIENRKKRRNKL